MILVKDGLTSALELDGLEQIIKSIGEPEIKLKRQFRKPALKYYNCSCGFDIETTNCVVDGEKQAWLYEWTFGIKDTIIIGRYWSEFLTLLAILQSIYSAARWVIYVHNLGFEFQFFRGYIQPDEVFAVDNRSVVYCRKDNLEFRDSAILAALPLSKVADNLLNHSIKKLKGDLDYSLIRTSETELTNEELQYCINDVLIILYYIDEQIDEFGDITKIPLTNTGRVREHCRKHCLYTTNSKGKKVRNTKYLELMEMEKLTTDLYQLSKLAFRGGFVHSSIINNMMTLEKVGSYDLTSAYPSFMVAKKFPVGEPMREEYLTVEEYERYIEFYGTLSMVKYTNLRMKKTVFDSYLSWIPAKMTGENIAQLNNGRITKAGELTLAITNLDYEIIKNTYDYDSVEFFNNYLWEMDYLPKELIECVLEFFTKKTTLKGVKGKEAEYQNSKGKLNSCYGMMVQDPLKEAGEYSNGEWSLKSLDIDEAIEKYNNAYKRFTYFPHGLWITGYCRKAIWDAILAAGEDYVYTDTDSVKLLNPEKHSAYFKAYDKQIKKELLKCLKYYNLDPNLIEPKTIKGTVSLLGSFCYEGLYDEFKTLGAKRYMVRVGNEYELTCAGVSKSAVDYIVSKGGFEFFNLDMKIPASATGKLTHCYIDTPFTATIMDYKGNYSQVEAKSAVYLEPAEYAINPDQEWVDWLLELEKRG